MEKVIEFVCAKIESGVLALLTKTSCPGKYLGLLTELAKLVTIGIFIPHEDGKNLSALKLLLILKLSLDLLDHNRR